MRKRGLFVRCRTSCGPWLDYSHAIKLNPIGAVIVIEQVRSSAPSGLSINRPQPGHEGFMEQVCKEAGKSMSSLYRVTPGSSQVRLPTGSRGRGPTPVSSPVSGSVALQAIRSACCCKRNASRNHAARRRNHAALIPAEIRRGVHVANDAACVMRLSNSPMPFTGEA